MKKIIFLTTRQLVRVDFSDPALQGWEIVLLAIDREIATLPGEIKAHFIEIVPLHQFNDDLIVPQYDKAACKKAFLAIFDHADEVCVICYDEGNIALANELRTLVRPSSITPDLRDAQLFRDKVLMKEVLQEKEVRVPRFLDSDALVSYQSYAELTRIVGEKIIIKPVDASGTQSVFLVASQMDFDHAKNAILASPLRYEAEEFIEGDLYHCDVVLSEGEVIFSQACRYFCPLLDFQCSKAMGSSTLAQDDHLNQSLIDFTLYGIRALGGFRGGFHCEIFVQQNTLIFLECAARAPGIIICTMYKEAFGINFLNLEIHVQQHAGKIIPTPTRQYQRMGCWASYPKGNGVVSTLNAKEDAGLERFHLDVVLGKIGDRHQGTKSNLDYVALGYFAGDASEVAALLPHIQQFQPLVYEETLV